MTIKEKIKTDFILAYKSKDMFKKNFLGVVLSNIETKIDKNIESTDENVLKVIKSIEKGINENIEGRKTSGLDIIEQELELSYIKPYQPELMSEDKVREGVRLIILEAANKNIGYLMGMFTKTYKGADMNMVKKIFGEELV